ncbi:MAG: hypothetical protein GWN07_19390, partial [Actinobacteria bacterium]|nr:hypothetical protein [Actinomycetota bacterium]NIX21882.1 hypothetical protein [Actinomycetota bacterium]
SSSITIDWQEATDNVGVTAYRVYRDGLPVLTTTGFTHTDDGLTPATDYIYGVTALDAAGNESVPVGVMARTLDLDEQPPAAPTGLAAETVSGDRIDLFWIAPADNVAVERYNVFRDGSLIGSADGPHFEDSGRGPGAAHSYAVQAVDPDGNVSSLSLAAAGSSHADANATAIDVWYGNQQTFGDVGMAQTWVNILGNVSDPDGVASLSYSLDGGPFQSLSLGPDGRRLYFEGDFVVELATASLSPGAHSLVLRAVDGGSNVRERTVQLTVGTNSWPTEFVADWSLAGQVQDGAQIVDGDWLLVRRGARTSDIAYDRLLAIGNRDWKDYEVTIPFEIHGYDPAGFIGPSGNPGFGLIVRWTGHTDSPVACGQPHCGWLPHG